MEYGTLQRNFQGYSTHGDCDLIGLGVSAIGHIGNAYAQNATSKTRMASDSKPTFRTNC